MSVRYCGYMNYRDTYDTATPLIGPILSRAVPNWREVTREGDRFACDWYYAHERLTFIVESVIHRELNGWGWDDRTPTPRHVTVNVVSLAPYRGALRRASLS